MKGLGGGPLRAGTTLHSLTEGTRRKQAHLRALHEQGHTAVASGSLRQELQRLVGDVGNRTAQTLLHLHLCHMEEGDHAHIEIRCGLDARHPFQHTGIGDAQLLLALVELAILERIVVLKQQHQSVEGVVVLLQVHLVVTLQLPLKRATLVV